MLLNFKKGFLIKMQYDEAIEHLCAAKGKDIPQVTIKGIYRLFDEMDAKDIDYIVRLVEKYENIPSNMYGLIDRLWSERKYWKEQKLNNTDDWKADPDNASGKEFSAFFAVLNEIFLWHTEKLVQSNPEGVTVPMDISEWKRSGCPKTWSPIVDNFLTGYLKMYTTTSESNLLLYFMNNYKDTLVKERLKRMYNK